MSPTRHRPRRHRDLPPVVAALLVTGLAFTLSGCDSSVDPVALRLDYGPPQVSQTTPADGAVGVSPEATITVTFNEAMDPGSIHFATFRVEEAGSPVPGMIAGLGRRFTFAPDRDLLDGRLIEVVIDGVADAAGNRIAQPFRFGFRISGSAPVPPRRPSNPYPGDGAIQVPIDTTFTWDGGSDSGDGVTYDFLLGTSPDNLNERATDLTTERFDPGPLSYVTLYFWQVIARSAGGETDGPIWSFATQTNPNPTNQPPATPCSPQPADGALSVPTTTSLSWGCLTDPDGDTVTFEVYLGTATSPPPVGEVTGPPFTPAAPLSPDTLYRWRIIADDGHGGRTAGPTWTFRTAAAPPPNAPPSAPAPPINPPDRGTTSDVDVDLTWSGGDDPDGDPVSYDVHFGTANPPPFVATVSVKSYRVEDLAYDRRYFWRIVARDDHGNQTAGPIWRFDTPLAPNQPPSAPCSFDPPNNATDLPTTVTLTWSCGEDPDGDPVTYAVFLERNDSTPDNQVATVTEKSYTAANLQPESTYYWRIEARDNRGGITSGPVLRFTTLEANDPPTVPCDPQPEDEATGVPFIVTLEWGCGTDPNGDSVTYDVYFGNTPDPPFLDSTTQREYFVGAVELSRTYFWRIVARDSRGAESSGPVWSFTTVLARTGP